MDSSEIVWIYSRLSASCLGLTVSLSVCLSVCLSLTCLSLQERVCGQGDASPILLNSNSLREGEDHSRRSTNMPPPKTKKLLNPRARPSGLQRPLQRGGGTRVLGVRPNGCKKTEGPMKARVRYTVWSKSVFPDYD